jgi:hypothetical protein
MAYLVVNVTALACVAGSNLTRWDNEPVWWVPKLLAFAVVLTCSTSKLACASANVQSASCISFEAGLLWLGVKVDMSKRSRDSY